MMFGRRHIKEGDYVFAVRKEENYNLIIIGKVQSITEGRLHVRGSYIKPTGLIERVKNGRAGGRPKEVLDNPDPNNCIFMLIDKVESGIYNQEIDQHSNKMIWINEKRFFVLDGWVRENLPEMFADVLGAQSEQGRLEARALLLEKMESLYEKDLKEHLYAVARSTRIL
jgi:hypothetical protein